MVYLSFKTTEVCDSTTVKMLTSIMLTYIGPKKSGDDNYFISRHFITYSSGNCEIVQQPVDEELTSSDACFPKWLRCGHDAHTTKDDIWHNLSSQHFQFTFSIWLNQNVLISLCKTMISFESVRLYKIVILTENVHISCFFPVLTGWASSTDKPHTLQAAILCHLYVT